jgi:DNA (cytosine-5)-methyltransferase 1
MMKALELFAGAGGLGMGVGLAGFQPLAVVEWDKWACDTIRENKQRGFPLVKSWPLIEGDVREFDLASIPEGIDLVAGGPPCQPFSMGGKHMAFKDERDMFPVTIETVRRLRPRAFIVENVKEFPEVTAKRGENWNDHYKRLQAEKASGRLHGSRNLAYNVIPTVVNAADYGVPQKRERVFIVGFRDDLGIEWSFPRETHSLDALLHAQWVTGEYWDRHEISKRRRPQLPESSAPRVDRLRGLWSPRERAWETVRDALEGLPQPSNDKSNGYTDHRLQPGARSYPGHTGSPLDQPAKTLKAGGHGVPGGENMMVLDSGEVRYFTVRESARLQTFPDGFIFHGSWTEVMRQLGNAVPVSLAQIVASSVAEKLIGADTDALRRRTGAAA